MSRHKKPPKTVFEGTKKLQISNDGKQLPVNAEDLALKESTREDQFVMKLFAGLPVRQAAIASGYSEAYASGTIYHKFKNPRFANKIREMAKGHNIAMLPRVLNVYRKGLDRLDEDMDKGNVESFGKLARIPRDLLKMNNLLHDDPAPAVGFVNIEHLQAVIQNKMGLLPAGRDDGTKDE